MVVVGESLPVSKTILIVGDYELMRKSLREWVQHWFPQYRVMDSTHGEEAVAMARAISPFLVLVDTGWFCTEGFVTARRFKSALPTTPIIFVSVRSCGIDQEDPAAAWNSVYVLKQNLHTELWPTLPRLLLNEEHQGGMDQTAN